MTKLRPHPNDRGAVLALTAAGMVVVLVAASMAVDLSARTRIAQQMQNAVDAAALAGVHTWVDSTDTAQTSAVIADVLNQNGFATSSDLTVNVDYLSATSLDVTLTDLAPPSFLRIVATGTGSLERSASAELSICEVGCDRTVAITEAVPSGSLSVCGVVNTYWPVTWKHDNNITIGTQRGAVHTLAEGDRVLLFQSDDDPVPVSGSTLGNYEFANVVSVSGSSVMLDQANRDYDTSKSTQLVYVPTAGDISVDCDVTAAPYDGSTGGVIALVGTDLEMNADIDASGAGHFRQVWGPYNAQSFDWSCTTTTYPGIAGAGKTSPGAGHDSSTSDSLYLPGVGGGGVGGSGGADGGGNYGQGGSGPFGRAGGVDGARGERVGGHGGTGSGGGGGIIGGGGGGGARAAGGGGGGVDGGGGAGLRNDGIRLSGGGGGAGSVGCGGDGVTGGIVRYSHGGGDEGSSGGGGGSYGGGGGTCATVAGGDDGSGGGGGGSWTGGGAAGKASGYYLSVDGGHGNHPVAATIPTSRHYLHAHNPKLLFGGSGGYGSAEQGLLSAGSGGGVILLDFDNIDGRGHAIRANGADGLDTPIPGTPHSGSGAGAGGQMKITAARFVSTTVLSAQGGTGGTPTADHYHAGIPGGGGGGGGIWVEGLVSGSGNTNSGGDIVSIPNATVNVGGGDSGPPIINPKNMVDVCTSGGGGDGLVVTSGVPDEFSVTIYECVCAGIPGFPPIRAVGLDDVSEFDVEIRDNADNVVLPAAGGMISMMDGKQITLDHLHSSSGPLTAIVRIEVPSDVDPWAGGDGPALAIGLGHAGPRLTD